MFAQTWRCTLYESCHQGTVPCMRQACPTKMWYAAIHRYSCRLDIICNLSQGSMWVQQAQPKRSYVVPARMSAQLPCPVPPSTPSVAQLCVGFAHIQIVHPNSGSVLFVSFSHARTPRNSTERPSFLTVVNCNAEILHQAFVCSTSSGLTPSFSRCW